MRAFLFLLGAFCVWQVFAANHPSVTYNITPLMTDPSGAIPMLGGKKIQLKSVLSPGTQVLFEDMYPRANWGHPGFFKVVSKEGALLEKVKVNLPPEHLEIAPVVEGSLFRSSSQIEFKLDDFKGQMKVADPKRFYALLINGHADQRHWNDFSFLYRVLVQIYGYHPANIFVADSVYRQRAADLDGNGTEDIQYESTLKGIRELLGTLKQKLQAGDQLLVAINDHGNTSNGESTIVLFDGEMTAGEFGKLLKDLVVDKILAIYEQCFSGGFIRPSVGQKRVAMSAATNIEYSWATADLNFDEFIYHVIAAFARQTHDGKAVGSDINGDGKISAQEAFGYASARDAAPESPALESHINSGNASEIGLNF